MSRKIKVELGPRVHNGTNYGGDKETTSSMNVLVVRQGKIVELMTIRWYMGRSRSASQVYCTVWVHHGEDRSGSGTAGGYGYDKRSAAFADALGDANIEYSGSLGSLHSLSGAGMRAVRDTCDAIVRKLGYRSKPYFVEN